MQKSVFEWAKHLHSWMGRGGGDILALSPFSNCERHYLKRIARHEED